MLEGLVAWVINNYLGKYVENLNTDQLSIALLQGSVELENLPLKKDALRHVGLPIEVRAGFIGKVKIQIPVTQITTAPWEIVMEKLYLVAGPLRLSDLDQEMEEQALVDYKLSLLDEVEARWRSETDSLQDTSYYASSYSSWLGLSMSFATNIIENLQLKIKDVHIRYEDEVTIKNEIFSFGVKIDSLVAQSCDNSWRPCFVSFSNNKESFKLVELTGFSVYCDKITQEYMWGDFELNDLRVAMSKIYEHEYLLSPVKGVAHLKRNRAEKPLRSRTNPRIICDLNLEQVPLILGHNQYVRLVQCIRGLKSLSLIRAGIMLRPNQSAIDNPRAWWKYAFQRSVPKCQNISNWNELLNRARDNIIYVKLYIKLLNSNSSASPLDINEKANKERIEWHREFEELKLLREVAMGKVRPTPPRETGPDSSGQRQGLSVLANWFPQWWWGSSSSTGYTVNSSGCPTSPEGFTTPPDTLQNSAVATPAAELEDKLLDALADTFENNTLLKRDMVFGQFNFTLKQGTFNLCDKLKKPLMELQYENVKMSYESRPRTGSHGFRVTLGALYLKDHVTIDSAFPVLISPQKGDSCPSGLHSRNLPPGLAKILSQNQNPSSGKEQPLFSLSYEYKPFNSSTDNKLLVRSKSLDIVYNPGAVKWIIDFFTGPYFDPLLRRAAQKGYAAMKQKTKKQLLSNWENILQGHLNNRKTWDIELDISAPQIFLVEHFNDKNAVLCVVDFGKLHFTNRQNKDESIRGSTEVEDEENEAFQTPCSTPPGSAEAEDLYSLCSPKNQLTESSQLNEYLLHNKLYDRYVLDFCELQILVGRVRDNWKFAHVKGTSTLHVLDRFNISLQIERRVVYTVDPQFPSLTISGNLPKLVVHVNEQKVQALRTLTDVISGKGLISPLRSHEVTPSDESKLEIFNEIDSESDIIDQNDTGARLLMLHFSIDQLALEIQSRGRSVAELQVNGVKLSFTKRPYDTSMSLSVHGLLLVDALQTFGPDFELLVASHKHVGMDSVSGSLQDSEPTSPISPASPDPEKYSSKMATSAVSIKQALSTLSQDKQYNKPSLLSIQSPPTIKLPEYCASELPDSEALITVELLFVSADCPTNEDKKEHLQVANIQFNNLDITANQETIVELIGFVRRLFPNSQSYSVSQPANDFTDYLNESKTENDDEVSLSEFKISTKTQLTFDFHRLNVLLLRGVIKDNGTIGRKIGTATMTEAKVHAIIGSTLEVEGSLGGLQVIDLTPEGRIHQRILSVGKDPLVQQSSHSTDTNRPHSSHQLLVFMAAEMYNMSAEHITPPQTDQSDNCERQAFHFSIKRSSISNDSDIAEISIKMASVWYTHSPQFLSEVKSCAADFKQYLTNLAKSIGSAATEVALGLVHARTESLAQSLSMGNRLYGSTSDLSQISRRLRRYSSSSEFLDFSKGTATPQSPQFETTNNTVIKWNVILASPVVVLPRNPDSFQVIVAHLGRISLTNIDESPVSSPWGQNPFANQHFNIQIDNINLYTIDITARLKNAQNLADAQILQAEKLYSCYSDGKPVLYDTSLQLSIIRELSHIRNKQQVDDILLDGGADFTQVEYQEALQINGKMVTPLKLSLSRGQYEQLLDTTDAILTAGNSELIDEASEDGLQQIVEDAELDTGVSTLSLDPTVRARMLQASGSTKQPVFKQFESKSTPISIAVSFELPELTLELRADLGIGEQGLVDLSFKELIIQFDRSNPSLTNIQMSLQSVLMEDLQKPIDSKHRYIMISSTQQNNESYVKRPKFISHSCPNFNSPQKIFNVYHSSLPDHLETEHILGAMSRRHRHIAMAENSIEIRKNNEGSRCPYTPPPSPRAEVSPNIFREDNLVHINVAIKQPTHPNLNVIRNVKVNFNSLDVIVNIESWVVVLDFFGISDLEQETVKNKQAQAQNLQGNVEQGKTNTELELAVRSLSVMLNRAEYEVAKASMTQLSVRLVNLAKNGKTETEASVGSFSLLDLTPCHGTFYRERFVTAGLNLSMTNYNLETVSDLKNCDIRLKLVMTSLVYVHTQRYIAELQTFFRLFPYLRKRIGSSKGKQMIFEDENTISTRLLLELSAESPIIILPMSSQSKSVLIADLGHLNVKNQMLMSGSKGTITSSSDPAKDALLDVMSIEMQEMDVLTGERQVQKVCCQGNPIPVGSYYIERKGTSLLREKCHLKLHVERNLMTHLHCVPDLTIHGILSTLAATLTLPDYKLISGLLSFNIGECLDDLQIALPVLSRQPSLETSNYEINDVWTCTSLNFELVDVNVWIVPPDSPTLACINFIKSHLLIETHSNRTQDVDLVSHEISIIDTRFQGEPANKRSNVFTNILQPIGIAKETGTVQAQVHHRKRLNLSKFTILLNNMRLMAVFDWWECVNNFIMTKPDYVHPVVNVAKDYDLPVKNEGADVPFELKLNITDSEVVFVEDTSQWDTNAVILKSTTVITYRPLEIEKPVSCNLNHCEMFSCILGMEDETALSIIEPVTINLDIISRQNENNSNINKILKIQISHLSLRLSYHDMRMFSQMLKSLQTQQTRNQSVDIHPANFRNQIGKLKSLGFDSSDCTDALNQCNGQLDEAALWLTQNANPSINQLTKISPTTHSNSETVFNFDNIVVDIDNMSLCVIDDCRDADVPLVEFSLTELNLKHNLDDKSGQSHASFLAYYYNRLLSGWEPFIEPWSCQVCWDNILSNTSQKSRIELNLASAEELNINVTSSLIDLYCSVRDTWTDDYYNPKDSINRTDGKVITSPPGYRRRSPFVPFAMKNDTGLRIWYKTMINTEDCFVESETLLIEDDRQNWILVEPGTILPFSFQERGKLRHRDTHKLRAHQVSIRVEGWNCVGPITVDKVGTFFRQASPDFNNYSSLDHRETRVVLDVTLEGSARKLITVRSALQIINYLPNTIEVKLDSSHIFSGTKGQACLHLVVLPNITLSVPLNHSCANIWVRPLDGTQTYFHAFSTRPIAWNQVTQPGEILLEHRQCHNNRGQIYRFCASVKRENYPVEKLVPLAPPLSLAGFQPAHTISLVSPLTLINLLPYDLYYKLNNGACKGRIISGQEQSIQEIDVNNPIELSIHFETFPYSGIIELPNGISNYLARIKLVDHSNRRLYLQAHATYDTNSSLKISISAPYWLVNKTALPLLFRQAGVATETAGQYEEHEIARMVAPLLFSFSEMDVNPTVVARVGSGVHPEGVPQWCQQFTLQPGVQVRRLKIALRDNRPDLVYVIGIEVRRGRGRYRSTNIVALTAHYQIHNKCSYKLQLAQKCFSTTFSDPGAQSTYLKAVPNCSLPFHWPRLDKDQLLCLKILDIPQCLWSGGFKIDDNKSFHINIRDANGRMYFLRIEIVLQEATFFIVITDADTMPPPIRIDNFSLVQIKFHQVSLTNFAHTVRPHTSVPYAWDESTKPSIITLIAPDGVSANYQLDKLGDASLLTYENFIYIALTGTFKNIGNTVDPLDIRGQQLVLDVPDSSTGKIILSKKAPGCRSQLWRMTANGLLQHEGSSPPRASFDKTLVLDICGPAPQPNSYVGLMIRRPDKRRTSTQSWRFTEDGRLRCAHNNMCVQAKDGFFGLRRGSEVVLGPPQPFYYETTETGIPMEQAVGRQRLRPGSGCLAVKIISDGPTRVIRITDISEKQKMYAAVDEGEWLSIPNNQRPNLNFIENDNTFNKRENDLQLCVQLHRVGISLISQKPPEELVFATLSGIQFNVMLTSSTEIYDISIQDVQIDNQQFESLSPVVLYVTPSNRSTDPDELARSAIHINAERTPSKRSYNANIFKFLLVRVKNISLIIDERLLLKLYAFTGWNNSKEENENADESDFETQRILAEAASVYAKRYYFDSLKIIFSQVRLSVITSNKLNKRLLSIKRKLGLTLIKFEDAAVDLEPFIRQYVFECGQFLWNSIMKHYKAELKWQAGIILGSVDFLGNPLGFVNDVTEGVSGLLYEGNVGALVKNVTHGISNSAAKVTESLGDGLGRVILDENHEEIRQKIRNVQPGSSGEHLMAGLKGFGFGILGGVTSVFKQTYEGASSDGFQGFISGLGKGLVGTVTKPVVGVLDLASETASAVRDSSRSSSRQMPNKRRLPRCVTSPIGFLPIYNQKQSQGQQHLYTITDRNYKELFMAYEILKSGNEDLRIVISSESVRVFSYNQNVGSTTVVFEKKLSDLFHCSPLELTSSPTDKSNRGFLHYIELTMKAEPTNTNVLTGHELIKRPRVRCDNEVIANWVSQQVNYAKAKYVERQHTLVFSNENILEE